MAEMTYVGKKELHAVMWSIAQAFERWYFPGMEFALLVLPCDEEEDGEKIYISNLQRADMVHALREAADRIEGGQANG